jgi:hypothetical protein
MTPEWTSPLSLRQAATELDVEPWRMARLGRYLRIDANDKCIPREEVERARRESGPDDRYLVILHCLLGEFRARHERTAGA